MAKRKIRSMEEWRAAPENARNTPKLSPEENQRIIDEAIAHDRKWDTQEKINARRQEEFKAECGGGLEKITAPAKFDAMVPTPRCQAGAGAFGTYFVHDSEKYGIKLFRDTYKKAADWEFDRLGKAHYAGVNVPEPLAINSSTNAEGDYKETLTLRHMKGYGEASDIYQRTRSTLGNAPLVVQVKTLREFRKLHAAGLAHGDIHGGNIMVNERAKRVALVDFGYSTHIQDDFNPNNSRNGVDNLMIDLRRLPEFVGVNNSDFQRTYKGVYENIEKQAKDYSRTPELYDLAINRYHDALEREVLQFDKKVRSKFVSGADQPRIPGLTRRIITARMPETKMRQMIEQLPDRVGLTAFEEAAKDMGLNRNRLFVGLKPERDARLAANKKKPFGTPMVPVTTRRGQRDFFATPTHMKGVVLSAGLSEGWED